MFTALAAALVLAPAPIRVMSFNVLVGGTKFQPLSQTVKAVEAARADVVGVQEPGENLAEIAKGLGWNHSAKASVVTRFEIVEDWKVDGNRWGGAKVRLPDGSHVLVYNDHFNPYPYGPYEVRDGKAKTPEEAKQVEADAGRVAQMGRVLANLAARRDRTLPVVFTGDFNTPSHLDWVEATRERTFGMTVAWPVTRMAEEAGFRDGYRDVHPDPKAKPGYTWSPGYPVGTLDPKDVMDRIDFVVYRGALRPTGAWVVGETGPVTDIAVDPWPSDHRAVVVEFVRTKEGR